MRKIGEGGMASVFLATDEQAPSNAAPVVIKRLHERLEQDRDAVDLFLTEADVTMMLDHPNVIRVYDCGDINAAYYMCMEYVQGKDLEQIWERLRQKGIAMPPDLAVQIMVNVLKGLDYVHNAKTPSGRSLGIVHRDVTPSNVYVSGTGMVKLGDFGVAKLAGIEKWTMAGSLKGKLGYLSPEQVAGEQPEQSIDLWAAAIIFYELLTGQRAFNGQSELDIMLKVRHAKIVKARKLNKSIPRSLAKILKKALHKKERKRYQSAGEILEALLEYQAKEGRAFNDQELVQALTQVLS